MHTWTVTCDPAVAEASGTAATEVDAVIAGAAALRRLVRDTDRAGAHAPFVNLTIDAQARIGVTAGQDDPGGVLEWIDDYEHHATIAAAVDDCLPDLGGLDPAC
ncbi:hypothetical protein [Rhodococcus zopfii]|uniref:hypothetical protein n=1 Tax=Rhodococcus zopfii TaxID=43772 RepID=UPI0009324443|nr:hypothetical protein [Rhodococcus zopfii]OOL30473.1 hypothetical protein GQ85_19605 [Rhodococcus rhodochrous]